MRRWTAPLLIAVMAATARRAVADPPSPSNRRFIEVEETDEGPLTPRSEGARIQVGALVQMLAGATPELPGGFRLRRARVVVDGELEPTLRTQVFLELEASPTSDLIETPLSEAFIAFDVASRSVANVGRLRIGQTKVGFGRELGVEPQRLAFVDRSLTSRCLGPGAQRYTLDDGRDSLRQATGRDTGMRWDLRVDLPRRFGVDALAGAYSGAGPNRIDAGLGPLFVGRLVGRYGPDDPARLHVTLGASAAQADYDQLRDRCGAVEPAVVRGIGTRRFGADLHLRYRLFTLDAEAIALHADATPPGAPIAGPGDALGGFVAGGLFFIADFAEATARWERVRYAGRDIDELTLGVNARYYGDRFRLQYNFVRRTDLGASAGYHVVAFTVYL